MTAMRGAAPESAWEHYGVVVSVWNAEVPRGRQYDIAGQADGDVQ